VARSRQFRSYRRELISLACLLAAGCSNAAERAEQQYAIVEKTGTTAEKCNAARKVEQAWLERRDQAKYEEWRQQSAQLCLNADMEQRAGL
jgi:hypothetical protein